MSVSDPLVIRNIATGVPGLDAVLGGGLCEFFQPRRRRAGVGKDDPCATDSVRQRDA
jgi:hypothetical protein